MCCLQVCLSLALVFSARVPSNVMASSVTPSSHLFWVFIPLFCCELLAAGLSLVYDVPQFWSPALPTEYTDLMFHVPKLMSICLAITTIMLCSFLWSEAFHEVSKQYFFADEVVSPMPNPPLGGLEYPFLSGSSPLTCLVWDTLPVTTHRQCSSQGHLTTQSPPLCQSKGIFRVPFLNNSV
jgi:hypothetical protein